jgi:hypothetical protein
MVLLLLIIIIPLIVVSSLDPPAPSPGVAKRPIVTTASSLSEVEVRHPLLTSHRLVYTTQ